MNKAKAARMSRDLKFGFVGLKLSNSEFKNQIKQVYTNTERVSKLERVRRYFDKW